MVPGVLVALLVPKVLKFEKQLDLTASTRGTPADALEPARTFLERCFAAHAASRGAFHHCGHPNGYAHRFRKFFICPLRRFKTIRTKYAHLFIAIFIFRGFYGYHVKRVAYESGEHLCSVTDFTPWVHPHCSTHRCILMALVFSHSSF